MFEAVSPVLYTECKKGSRRVMSRSSSLFLKSHDKLQKNSVHRPVLETVERKWSGISA